AVLAVESVAIAVPVHPVSNLSGAGLDTLEPYLQPGRTAVLLGSSGVGKSSLLNRLAGAEVMQTRAVAADGTGRHTTTHRELEQIAARTDTRLRLAGKKRWKQYAAVARQRSRP